MILWISRYDYDDGWVLLPHLHEDFYQLIYCISGSGLSVAGGESHRFSASSIVFIRPGTEHSISEIGKSGLQTIDVKFIVRNRNLRKKLETLPVHIDGCDQQIRDNLEKIRMEGENQNYEYVQYSQLYLSMVLLDLIRMQLPVRVKDYKNVNFYYQENLSDLCIRILAYIENNYRKHVTADDISAALNYSYRYLSDITKKEIGCSPVELVDWYRCHLAKENLVLSELTLKEISEMVGYPNVHHFSRTFKRIAGIPPATYRKEAMLSVRKDIKFFDGFVNINNTLKN